MGYGQCVCSQVHQNSTMQTTSLDTSSAMTLVPQDVGRSTGHPSEFLKKFLEEFLHLSKTPEIGWDFWLNDVIF